MATTHKILMLVENLPVPADSRVWAEATTLRDQGFQVALFALKIPLNIENRISVLTTSAFIATNYPQW